MFRNYKEEKTIEGFWVICETPIARYVDYFKDYSDAKMCALSFAKKREREGHLANITIKISDSEVNSAIALATLSFLNKEGYEGRKKEEK